MKSLMPPIDTPDQVFHDGDPSTGDLGTICSAEWLNNVQGNIRNIQAECIAILKATGFTPDSTNDGQLWEAIQVAIKSQVPAATVTTAGITQLSSSVTSDSETIAATLKAVKIAMDNANARLAKDRNGADIPNKALFRQSLELGNSATLNTGTTAGTVAAGDDARILATKKAVEDTQTGLSEQPVMWISSADDLSNLPAGARRFAKNNTGVTVLPSEDYCYIEVLAKRDTANGSCIKVVEYSNPGNAWTGTRNNVPVDAAFTWVRQYNESYRPPQQAMPNMPDALIRGNNLSDLTDPAAGVRNLGLTDTVNRAAHVHAGDGDLQGSQWGNTWLSTWLSSQFNARATTSWVQQNFLSGFRLGAVERAQVWRGYGYDDEPPYVITSVLNTNSDELIDFVKRRSLQMYINGWRNVDWL
ncbi:TPA: phage tail protein [Salmonella enterica]|uniref:tail fiber protein n=1 Tax=Salmonella sp. SG203 TaxID=2555397 RepID=UPI0015842B6D|nr:tail fiber protein [Salmonella sp. SG203]